MLVAPEQLTVEDGSRNPEDTDLVGLLYDTVVIRLTIAGEIGLESRTVTTGFRNQTGDRVRVVDIQFTLPEAVSEIVIVWKKPSRSKNSVPICAVRELKTRGGPLIIRSWPVSLARRRASI